MPITASAKKALRQNIRRHARNLEYQRRIKEAIKTYRRLIATKKIGEAKEQLRLVYETLDKVAKSGYIKKNMASRKKSRLSKLLGKIS